MNLNVFSFLTLCLKSLSTVKCASLVNVRRAIDSVVRPARIAVAGFVLAAHLFASSTYRIVVFDWQHLEGAE